MRPLSSEVEQRYVRLHCSDKYIRLQDFWLMPQLRRSAVFNSQVDATYVHAVRASENY